MSKSVGVVGLGGLSWWLELADFTPVVGVDEVCERLGSSKFPVVCADLEAVGRISSVRSKPIFLMLVSSQEDRFDASGVNAKIVWVYPSDSVGDVLAMFGLPDNRIPAVSKAAVLADCIDVAPSSGDDDGVDLWGDDDEEEDTPPPAPKQVVGPAPQQVVEPEPQPVAEPEPQRVVEPAVLSVEQDLTGQAPSTPSLPAGQSASGDAVAPSGQTHSIPGIGQGQAVSGAGAFVPHQAPARTSVADVLAKINSDTPKPATAPPPPTAPAVSNVAADPVLSGLPGSFEVPNVLLVWAPMGGVGKSSLTQAVAVWAARAGLSVVLVDGNAGQADQQLMLGIGGANVATIADWPRGADEVFTSAGAINRLRGDDALPANFAFIAGASERPVSADIFLRAVNYASTKADMVVVDTQVVDTKVASTADSMVSDFMLPLWRGGAFGLGLMEPSSKGASNLHRWMRRLADVYHLDMSNQMVAVNKMPYSLDVDTDQLEEAFSGLGRFVGSAYQNDQLFAAMSFGGLSVDDENLAGIASRVVYRMFPDKIGGF